MGQLPLFDARRRYALNILGLAPDVYRGLLMQWHFGRPRRSFGWLCKHADELYHGGQFGRIIEPIPLSFTY
jgi:hypothetical protein